MSKQGFIQLHRRVRDHWLYQEKRTFSKFEAWIDMLMMANHKDNKFLLGNELVEVKRGEFITSELKLMDRWKWGKSKTRNFLSLLENDEMIVKKSDRKKTTITICNYSLYHDKEKEIRPQSDHNQTDSRPIADTNNNVKNVKNDKKGSRKQVYDENSLYYKMADYFYRLILKNNPQHKKPNYQNWSDEFRKLVELDKRDKDQVRKVMEFVQTDDFEMKNVLSPNKLRKRYDQLFMKARKVKVFKKPNYEVNDSEGINAEHSNESGDVKLFR